MAEPFQGSTEQAGSGDPIPAWIEQRLREEWWMGHGCSVAVLYGDDGEMQCGPCAHHGVMDFKRLPLQELREAVEAARLSRAAKAVRQVAPAPPSEHVCRCGTVMICPDIGCDENKLPEAASASVAGETPWQPDIRTLLELGSAMKKVLPPELLATVLEHLDPVGTFTEFLRGPLPPAPSGGELP